MELLFAGHLWFPYGCNMVTLKTDANGLPLLDTNNSDVFNIITNMMLLLPLELVDQIGRRSSWKTI
jgi:hypothetical protein